MKENGCQLSLQVMPREIKDTLKGKDAVIHNQALTTSPMLILQSLQNYVSDWIQKLFF